MENIEKDFVPYKESIELKEIGFDEPCFAYWDGDRIFIIDRNSKIIQKNSNYKNIFEGIISSPTFSQAFRFFREKYKLHSKIEIQDVELDWYCYEILEVKNEQYFNDLHMDMNFKSYEEAELACVRKLIEIVKNRK